MTQHHKNSLNHALVDMTAVLKQHANDKTIWKIRLKFFFAKCQKCVQSFATFYFMLHVWMALLWATHL